jgi:membrane-bound lytic murein transglycosylase B
MAEPRPHKRLRTWQRATALVPLALLSAGWTASLALPSSTASASPREGQRLPDGTEVPSQAIEAPASVSRPGEIAPGVPEDATASVIESASTSGIPSAALRAYQRAAQVIDAADPSCGLDWQLIGAIGRVESDHGRYGGNILGRDGISQPGIFGIPLDGSNGTARISDTDAGQYDDDPVYDRAVGPMQFIPSTWSVVGVDGDGDGVRNPQDMDDAALATAVYLCSGREDLSTDAGRRSAVYRYNHSQEYVDLVLSVMRAYLDGDYSAVPNDTVAPVTITPSPTPTDRPAPRAKKHQRHHGPRHHQAPRQQDDPPRQDDPGSGGPAPQDTPTAPKPDEKAEDTGKHATDKVKDVVEDVTEGVEDTVSALDKAKQTCQANFTGAEIEAVGGLTACANAILDGGIGSVQATLDGLLDDLTGDDGLGGVVGGITGGGSNSKK